MAVDSDPARPQRGRPQRGVRQALLAATEALLAEAGVARLSTKEVARQAGAAESSIFYHFGDRLGLLQAAVRERLPPVAQVLDGVDRRDLRGGLVALLDALEAFYLRTMPITAAIQADGELRAAFSERSRELDIGPHRAVDAVAAYLVQAGASNELDLPAVALLLVGTAHERAIQRSLSPAAAGRLATSRAVVDLLLPVLTG